MRIWQGMSSCHAFNHRPTQVTLKVCKVCARNVAFGVTAPAVIGVFKSKTAVQNYQPGLFHTFMQGLRADQLRNRHSELLRGMKDS